MKLPEIKNSCADINRIVRSVVPNNILIAALKWKIFDYLNDPVNAACVADKLQFHARNTELFLNALAGQDIIKKQNGLFSNTPQSAEFLVSTRPEYLGDFFLHMHSWHKQFGSSLEELVKNGPPPKESEIDVSAGSIWAESARLSAAYHYAGPARYIANTASALPEFSGMKKMLDLGGGAGIFTIAIVQAHPDMEGVVFEQPSVAVVAREFISKYEMQDRIDVMEGSYLTDPLGDSYDLVFASATLNFAKDSFAPLFKKIYDSLNPGGVFITHQDGITAERTKPVCHIGEFLSAELFGQDFAIPQGLIAESMFESGFKSVRSFTVQSDFGDMDIDIARK